MKKKEIVWYRLGAVCNDFIQKSDPSFYYLKLVKDNWEMVLGSPLCEKITPYGWRGNKLVLTAKDSSYVVYVQMKQEIIASQVRAVLQNDYCRAIEIKKIN